MKSIHKYETLDEAIFDGYELRVCFKVDGTLEKAWIGTDHGNMHYLAKKQAERIAWLFNMDTYQKWRMQSIADNPELEKFLPEDGAEMRTTV